ncbi:MAG: alpha/beta fold hydrolase [Candidatus Omnitrophota bacterium]
MSVVLSLDIRNFIRARPKGSGLEDTSISLKGDNGCMVILIHGLTGTPVEMKPIAAHLNKKGYSVICPRLANHGEDIWVLKRSKWQDFYQSARDVVTSGEAASFSGPIFTAGLSMGSLLALLLADEFPDRIRGVSALAPTLFYDGWNMPLSKYFLPLAYTPLRHIYFFKEEPPYGIKNEAIQSRIHRYYNKVRLGDIGNVAQYGYPYFPVTLLHELHLLVKYITKKFPKMDFPVQLIQAKDDDMASIKNSKLIYDTIRSEIKEMVLLYDSYHVITADHERDLVAEKMEGFFTRVSDGLVKK